MYYKQVIICVPSILSRIFGKEPLELVKRALCLQATVPKLISCTVKNVDNYL